MACTVYVYGICLKCYVAVDVSECLSCCGDMEILPVQDRCAHVFLQWGIAEWPEWYNCEFIFPLAFSLRLSLSPSLCLLFFFVFLFFKVTHKPICIYFKHVHLFSFLCLADFALGH